MRRAFTAGRIGMHYVYWDARTVRGEITVIWTC